MHLLIMIVCGTFGLTDSTPMTTRDFANESNRDLWLRHPVWGDPSFDSFERRPGNPVHRGREPYLWPVNGFFFEDPPTGFWYLYVGHYLSGYELNAEQPSLCTVFRSTDKGDTWTELGPVMAPGEHVYNNEVSPVFHAPDVSVVYDDGIYHMCFDWTTQNTIWANAANPDANSNSGVGYARATAPEGPFELTAQPVATTRTQQPLLGKYRRLYASSLVRRENDWLVLTLSDSGPYFGWAMLGMTAPRAEGPYTEPHLLLHPESNNYHPPLLEFFPAFVHEDHVYMPATSVALNRNFVCMFRAPVEEAHLPDAWRIQQHGSLWHAAPAPHEHHGLWGQAFSGAVDGAGVLRVLFPSRDDSGRGTINLAERAWNQPFRKQGFVLSGHRGPSLVRTVMGGSPSQIRATVTVHGTMRFLWDVHAPLGADAPRSDSSLHPLMLTRCRYLQLEPDAWALGYLDENGEDTCLANGVLTCLPDNAPITVTWEGAHCILQIADEVVWQGAFAPGTGAFGIYTAPFSHADVTLYEVHAAFAQMPAVLLYTEALLGAAQGFVAWDRVESPRFRFGEGAVSKAGEKHTMLKWNFQGTEFSLWAPRGPEYGKARIRLNGAKAGTLDFHALDNVQSKPIFTRNGLADDFHTLILEAVDGARIPVDCLEFSR